MRRAVVVGSQLVVVLLLLVVGAVAQYRYDLVGQYGQFLFQSNTSTPTGLSTLLSSPAPVAVSPASIDMSQFWEAWTYLQNDFLETEKLEEETMVDGATQGLARSLGDPYTMYLPPEDNQRSAEDLAGSFYGVGIELGFINGVLAVVAPLAGSPAAAAGVEAGDLILRVADPARDFDEDTSNWTLQQAVNEIRGPRGSEVKLTLYRESNGDQPFEVTIVRDEIIVKSVELEILEHQGKTIAHIKLNRFGERTEAEWNQAVDTILASQPPVDGIILDMRNNPGGFFEGAIDIASDFVEDGVVVSQTGKTSKQDFTARGVARLKNYPVVVLVNKGSASASEIVAGALRDRLNIPLIGTQTFGKGTVQDRRELSNGGGLHVTVARWMLPNGDWIQDDGIPPTIEVEDDRETEVDEILDRALIEFN